MYQIQGFRGGWTGYFILGGLVARAAHNLSQQWLAALGAMGLATFGGVVYGTLELTLRSGSKLQNDWTLAAGAPMVMIAIPYFFVVRALGQSDLINHPRVAGIIRVIADHAYGMYFIQVFVLSLINFHMNAVLAIPTNALVMATISFSLAYGARRIPLVRYLVGGYGQK